MAWSAELRRENLEMMLLAKERREVGGQRIHELLPLWPVVGLQPTQVVMKAGVPRTPRSRRDRRL